MATASGALARVRFTEAFAPTRFVWDLQTTEQQLTAT